MRNGVDGFREMLGVDGFREILSSMESTWFLVIIQLRLHAS